MEIEPSDAADSGVAANGSNNVLGIDRENFESAMRSSLKDHWRLFTVQGVLLVILGMIAVALPRLAAVAASAFIGWLLFFSGLMRAVSLVRSMRAPGYWSSLLLAILTAILGFVLAWYPLQGAVTLTMLLTAYFLVQGIATFIFAFSIKGETGRWVTSDPERPGRPPAGRACDRGMAIERALGARAFCRRQHAAHGLRIHLRGAWRTVGLRNAPPSFWKKSAGGNCIS